MISLPKKLAALAVTGVFAGTAYAQSNVTLYGVVDAGFINSTSDRVGNSGGNSNFSGINSGIMAGSRLGFKGEEGLGNGLKAVFLLEYALAIDTNAGIGSGTGATSTRQSYVGLADSKLGTVSLGRQYAPAYYAASRNNPFGASTVLSPLTLLTAAGSNSITAGEKSRISNSVNYASPNWNGFTASAIYGYGETGQSTTVSNGVGQGSNGLFGAGLNYANGPLNLDLVFQQRLAVTPNPITTTPVTTVSTQDNINEWGLFGSYDFKVAKLFASYQTQKDDNGPSTREGSNNVWQLGTSVPVFGKGEIQASYVKLNWDRPGAGSDGWTLGYRHALSKRTTLYTTYGVVDNDRNALAAAGPIGATAFIGEKNTTVTAGINHTF